MYVGLLLFQGGAAEIDQAWGGLPNSQFTDKRAALRRLPKDPRERPGSKKLLGPEGLRD